MSKISDLLDRVDIVALINADFDLKDGTNYANGILHDSLVVDKRNKRFYWNSLGLVGNALDWVTHIKGYPLRDAVTYLQSFARQRDYPNKLTQSLDYEPNIYPKLLDTFFELGKTNREYWYRRGYNDKTIDKFKLGFTGRCYVIPIIYKGVLFNFQCRTPEKKIWAWTKNIGALPFNFDCLPGIETVIISESPVDAIMLTQNGFNAISQTGGAGTWYKYWNLDLVNLKTIILAYDHDLAGYSGAIKLGQMFKDRAKIFIWPDNYPEKYDSNDFFRDGHTVEEFYSLLMTRTYSYDIIKNYRLLNWSLAN